MALTCGPGAWGGGGGGGGLLSIEGIREGYPFLKNGIFG